MNNISINAPAPSNMKFNIIIVNTLLTSVFDFFSINPLTKYILSVILAAYVINSNQKNGVKAVNPYNNIPEIPMLLPAAPNTMPV